MTHTEAPRCIARETAEEAEDHRRFRCAAVATDGELCAHHAEKVAR